MIPIIQDLAAEVAKYAFLAAFYSTFPLADAEKHHAKENLKLAVRDLMKELA